ncbi:YciI family protein [Vibrio spartinae]|uniref:YciI-like protein n=1 Tax=Vibrio spartinae TaxID=1918945 RepID=A0A1N6MB96_9VIBR|nr:YciI family protein [Vibrio spartinae]SIO96636.1 YciI-like protein [Vibrio spartinae]
MNKYVAILSKKNRQLFSDELLRKHVSYLKAQEKSGVLVLCGPFSDNDSAIQVIMSDSLEAAKEIVQSDPFVSQGYYGELVVKELIEANAMNNWLIADPQTEANRASSQT